MENRHTISGLIRKRSELAGLIQKAEKDLNQLRQNLAHVDATLALFRSNLDPNEIKPKRIIARSLFPVGFLSRSICEALRAGPADLDGLTRSIMERANMNADDPHQYADVRKRLYWSLRDQCRAGRIIKGEDKRYRIVQ